MRDDSRKWTPSVGLDTQSVETDRVRLAIEQPERQTLISGPVDQALKLAGLKTAIGWPETAQTPAYALRLRRDRILVVNGPDLHDGWHGDPGLAISDMTGGYAVLSVKGPGALDLLKTGTELDPTLPSRSVARKFHGYSALLYRVSDPDGFRIHVARGHVDGLWSLLTSLI